MHRLVAATFSRSRPASQWRRHRHWPDDDRLLHGVGAKEGAVPRHPSWHREPLAAVLEEELPHSPLKLIVCGSTVSVMESLQSERNPPINDTLKGQLDLERHGGHTQGGVVTRVIQRLSAMTAAIWHNHHCGAAPVRSLIAYDHG